MCLKKSRLFLLLKRPEKNLEPIDILVNNTGMTLMGKPEEISEDDWDR